MSSNRVAHEDDDSDDRLRANYREFLQSPAIAAEKYEAQQVRRSARAVATTPVVRRTPCSAFEPGLDDVDIAIPPDAQTLFWGDTLGDEEIVALSDFQVCLDRTRNCAVLHRFVNHSL